MTAVIGCSKHSNGVWFGKCTVDTKGTADAAATAGDFFDCFGMAVGTGRDRRAAAAAGIGLGFGQWIVDIEGIAAFAAAGEGIRHAFGNWVADIEGIAAFVAGSFVGYSGMPVDTADDDRTAADHWRSLGCLQVCSWRGRMSLARYSELNYLRGAYVRQSQRKHPWPVVLSFSLYHLVEFSGPF